MKSRNLFGDSRIIAQTAYAMTEEKKRCLECGCHAYIAKPYSKEELYATIQSVLDSSVPA